MIKKEYSVSSSDSIPIASFIDEFGIQDFDISKLSITVSLDWSGVYYEGESPEISAVLIYQE